MSQRIWNPESFLFQLELKSIWASLTLCFEMTEKVSFNIASEASYGYKSSLKMPKMLDFLGIFENLKLAVRQCYQSCQL